MLEASTSRQFDPLRRWMRLTLFLTTTQILLLGIELFILLFMVNFNLQILSTSNLITIGFSLFYVFAYWATIMTLAIRSYRQSVPRRQQILGGAWQEHAPFQPMPNEASTQTSSISLDLRLNHVLLLVVGIIFILLFGCILSSVWAIYSLMADLLNTINNGSGNMTATTNIPIDTWFTYTMFACIWLAGSFILEIIVFFRLRRWLCPTLMSTEEGLTASYPGKKVSIRWSDVRYFAVVNRRSSLDIRNWTYELSDGEKIIRWQQPYVVTLFLPIYLLFPLYLPRLPRATYDREFANLLSLIATRTGRSLLDMQLR